MAPKVTVLLPVYNAESYLDEAIVSILLQTFTDYEFLIIDDGSTDHSVDIVNRYDDARIRVLSNPHRLKLSGALNRGLDEARGTYIARMDGDDIALPTRLQRQVEFLDTNLQVGICGTWVEKFDQTIRKVDEYLTEPAAVKAYTLFDCPFAHPTVMFRRDFFTAHNLRYNGWYYPTEDYELWSRAVYSFPCANIAEVLLNYRVHQTSMTSSDWALMDDKAMIIANTLLKRFGIAATEAELRLHRNIGRGPGFRLNSLAELHRCEAWLTRLAQANDDSLAYEQRAFSRVLGLIWFRTCMHASFHGTKVLYIFSRSRLAGDVGRQKIFRSFILFGSIVKSILRSKRPGHNHA
jgi:glycosyltransferase involved in cell wall biosynthesis